MNTIFFYVLNRGIEASWLILAVIVLRVLLQKAPRWIPCALWALAAFRLLCPLSLESPFSLIPNSEAVNPMLAGNGPSPHAYSLQESFFLSSAPTVHTAPGLVPQEPSAAVFPDGASTLPAWISLAALLWGAGLLFLLGFALLRLLRVRRMVREAVPLSKQVYLCDAVASPFILGILRPRVYLSSGIRQDQMAFVLAHEGAHLKHKDHWWKLLGYVLLSVYWIHPLCWAAYLLFCRDIELACDERVVRDMALPDRKAYSEALASLSLPGRLVFTYPLAFGEIGVKKRIQAVLSYQKPALWIVAASCAACLAAALCFLTHPKAAPATLSRMPSDLLTASNTLSDIPTVPKFSNTSTFEGAPDVSEGITLEGISEVPEPDLDAAISKAILRHNVGLCSWYPVFSCCDFASLGTVTLPPEGEGTPVTVVCYGWALYQDYAVSEEGIDLKYGSYLPLALTFSLDEDGYRLVEFWQPREGGYLASDVRAKFPEELAEDGIDSQKFGVEQTQHCYDQAVRDFGLNTEPVIGRLLEEICAEPSPSSNPQDYLDAHAKEYHELLYYGDYTLGYCFARFQEGGETGLEGQIMALVCEELLGSQGTIPADAATAANGQFWYDALYAHGSNRVEPYLP